MIINVTPTTRWDQMAPTGQKGHTLKLDTVYVPQVRQFMPTSLARRYGFIK